MNRVVLVLVGAVGLAGNLAAAPVPEGTRPAAKNKTLRVLMAGSAPAREWQFLRTLLVRQWEKGRVLLSVHLQLPPGAKKGKTYLDPALPAARSLKAFPDNLKAYDVVVAYDLDWERLSATQLRAVRSYVRDGGGLVVVAAPSHTAQLAGEGGKLKPVRELLPVVVGDPRKDKRDTTTAWKLTFPPVKRRPDYLKLDPKGKGPLAGWEEFFRGEHGFYSCHPVRSVRPEAVVLATFADPRARLGGGTERPFLATLDLGQGKVAYLGSGELWRLRAAQEEYYDRLWLGLLADVARR